MAMLPMMLTITAITTTGITTTGLMMVLVVMVVFMMVFPMVTAVIVIIVMRTTAVTGAVVVQNSFVAGYIERQGRTLYMLTSTTCIHSPTLPQTTMSTDTPLIVQAVLWAKWILGRTAHLAMKFNGESHQRFPI